MISPSLNPLRSSENHIQQRIEHEQNTIVDDTIAFQQMLRRVKGRWGTKVDALIADLLLLFAPSTTSTTTTTTTTMTSPLKVIVFSQWMELLEIVAEACRVNKLSFAFCKQRQKDFVSLTGGLESFRHDEKVGILLLPLSYGAEGLDLIIASHVFLLEPILSYSQELQAINRIHRLGQLHPTYVHKYHILGTVEEKIFCFQQQQRQGKRFTSSSSSSSRASAAASAARMDEDVNDDDGDGEGKMQERVMMTRKRDDEWLQVQDILQLVSSSTA